MVKTNSYSKLIFWGFIIFCLLGAVIYWDRDREFKEWEEDALSERLRTGENASYIQK